MDETFATNEPVPANALSGPAVPADPGARGSARSRPCVGPAVRRLRRERALTLADVAGRSGLNVGYLSQIENDKASPSLETLAALGEALDVPITWFLVDTSPPPRVVRAAQRPRRSVRGGEGSLEEVDGGIGRDVRIVEATIEPGRRTGLHAHAGDEHHLILAGRVQMTQGAHVVELGPGDYLVWDATVPHDAACLGDEPARMLIVGHRTHGLDTSRPAPVGPTPRQAPSSSPTAPPPPARSATRA
jgi:transcriptional regulator with XRE-family HTH domain